MQARSLLDYLSKEDQLETPEHSAGATIAGPNLAERLNELERQLAEATRQASSAQHVDLVSEIQTILRGKGIVPRVNDYAELDEKQNPSLRVRVDAPSLAPDTPQIASFNPDEVAKFAQAIQLLGVAAERFLPARNDLREIIPQDRIDVIEAKLEALQQDFQLLLRHLDGSRPLSR